MGLGGLGHMGLKFAHAFGAYTVLFTTSPVDTASASHDLNQYLALLRLNGTMTLLGAPEKPAAVAAFSLLFGRHRLAGSAIGGLRQTQEMLDFCGEHGLTSDIETIPIQKINEAYERLLKSDVKYRFVIDMASLKAA